MSEYFPEATAVLGNLNVRWLSTAADLEAIDISGEWDAGTSLGLSCFLRPLSPAGTQSTGSAPNRLCTTITLPQIGRTEISAFELRYLYDPQATGTSNNDALDTLVENAEGILVFRKGLPFNTAAAAGQLYEAWEVRLGRQNRVQSGDDDFAEFEISQMAFPTQDVVYGALVA